MKRPPTDTLLSRHKLRRFGWAADIRAGRTGITLPNKILGVIPFIPFDRREEAAPAIQQADWLTEIH